MSRRGLRILTAEDKALWRHVTQDVTPARGKKAPEAETGSAAPAPKAPVRHAKIQVAEPTPKPKPRAPPLVPLEKELKRRLSRRQLEPDDVIDLHGLTQEAAHKSLVAFLRGAQTRGLKLVKVITGKGGRSDPIAPWRAHESERGVLRRAAPHWLEAPDLRAVVVGYETAAAHHGGDGAFYVRIRRARH